VTQLERNMNVLVFVQFTALVVFCAVLAGLDQWWALRHSAPSWWYLQSQNVYPELPPGISAFFVSVSPGRAVVYFQWKLLRNRSSCLLQLPTLHAACHTLSIRLNGTLLWLSACNCCVLQFLRFLILLSNMIPISLYVSLEVVKVFQCTLLLNSDRQMYHRDTDTPFVCRTTTLNEELGQVRASVQ
jgi:hypothetical protein